MKAVATMVRTREAYEGAFHAARLLEYPEVDAFEQRMGYAIQRDRLENAARVLACPLKNNPPHWQHGRVIYAATRKYLESASGPLTMLDIGTAKGFSALMLQLACDDQYRNAVHVVSVDVIDPASRELRNTVAEIDGPLTLKDIIGPWMLETNFLKSTGIDYLRTHPEHIHVAFVDGKHDGQVVRQEGTLLAARQQCGDLAIFDDCQISVVCQAVVSLQEFYEVDYVTAGPREYAVGWRR